MKWFHVLTIILLITAIVYTSTRKTRSSFTGYIVCRENIKAHKSNESPEVIRRSVVIPVRPTVSSNSTTTIEEQFVWYVANRNEIIEHHVSKKQYSTKKCGDKVTIKIQ